MNLYWRLLWTLARTLTKERIAPLAASLTTWRVLPGDLDPFGHMTNARYLAVMDLARIDFLIRVSMLPAVMEHRWIVPVGSAHVDFQGALRPFEAYEVHTRLIWWDARWFYLQQEFRRKGGALIGTGYVKALFRGPKGAVRPDEVLAAAFDRPLARPSAPSAGVAARFGIDDERDKRDKRDEREPIAIVGIGCRLPGGAHDPEALFHLLMEGRECIVDIPASRWDPRTYHDPSGKSPGRSYVQRAGLLEGDLHAFDAAFFGISPREAMMLDPQQRMLLEVSWEALENGGLPPSSLAKSRTGVFAGGFMTDHHLVASNPENRERISTHSAAASTLTMLSNRLSYFYDLRGPSVSMDTACSSSLVALHYACQSIWSKESDKALVCGVNAIVVPETQVTMAKGKLLSPRGRCHAFDERADGYVRSEGAAVLVLEPLSVAQRAGHPIHAVILGTATNQDGKTAGISLPNGEAQVAVMREAYASAGIDPRDVVYMEAHGTGTPAGDPIEAKAIGAVVGAARDESDACLLGSVKTNLGHLEAAAGVTGVLKAALVLRHGIVPHHPHLGTVNPAISLRELGLRIPTVPTALPARRGGARVAGVNSFGYGGSNAHAVLAEAPRTPAASAPAHGKPHLLMISAKSKEALWELAERYAEAIDAAKDEDVFALCRSAAHHRDHHRHRIGLAETSRAGLVAALRAVPSSPNGTEPEDARNGKVLFVYTGMGPQWWGMGQRLMATEPVFRNTVDECDAAFRAIAGWSIRDEMAKPESGSRMAQTEIAQPANAVVQIALTRLWAEWGIVPDAVLGHSVGEVGAGHAAGALSLRDAMLVAYHRSQLQGRLAGRGGMLAVGLGEERVAAWIDGECEVAIAAVNSEESTTLAGEPAALQRIARRLETAGHFHRFLRVDVPYHSPMMDPLERPLLEALRELAPARPALPLHSTVTGALLDGNVDPLDARYWWRNVRCTVRFAEALRSAIDAGHTTFVEVGPHPVLAASIRDTLRSRRCDGDVIASLTRNEPEPAPLARALARFYALGKTPRTNAYYGPGAHVPIPSYPWQRKAHRNEGEHTHGRHQPDARHPLITHCQTTPTFSISAEINLGAAPYLADHVVGEALLFPGAGYIELALTARAMQTGNPYCSLEQIEFRTAVPLHEDRMTRLVLGLSPESAAFYIHGLSGDEPGPMAPAVRGKTFSVGLAGPPLDVKALSERLPHVMDGAELYSALARRGLRYGSAFRAASRVRHGGDEMLAFIGLDDTLDDRGYHLHPVLLDAALHSLIALAEDGAHDIVPIAIDRVQLFAPPGRRIVAHGRLSRAPNGARHVHGNVTLAREDGTLIAEVTGLTCRFLPRVPHPTHVASLFHARTWERAAPPSAARPTTSAPTWIVLDASTTSFPSLPAGAELHVLDLRACSEGPSAGDPTRRGIDLAEAFLDTMRGIRRGEVKRYYLMTKGAESVLPSDGPPHLDAAQLLGLARTAMTERADLHVTTIDLDAMPDSLPKLGCAALSARLRNLGDEQEVAFRGAETYVARVERIAVPAPSARPAEPPAKGSGYELVLDAPGRLETLGFVACERREPGAGEVEIEVDVASLGFKDVMKALGMLSARITENTFFGRAIGMDGAGRVVRIGPDVAGLAVGDRVYGVAPGFVSPYVVVPEKRIAKLPETMSFEDATSLSVLMTVHHALVDVARLRRGERILVHGATGGVGLAAIEVARALGADVFATAGSEEKRRYLRELGIAHVGHSRDLRFADEVRAVTAGRGVDVVLNFTPGEIMVKSLGCLAPFGRFIELGKMSSDEDAALPLRPFNENLLYASVDFDRIMEAKPEEVRTIAHAVLHHIERGDYRPIPTTTFPASAVADAFHLVARAQHIGKVCIRPSDPHLRVRPAPRATRFSSEASYLVTGGLGGFGLEVAKWMVAQGARHLALVGRRAMASPELDALRDQGAEVRVFAADAGSRESVQQIIDGMRTSMPPLRGVMHAAAVLDDRAVDALDRASLERAVSGKARGAWNLHLATEHAPLDFFVLFSSVASLVGNAHQGNYVAANAFLDQLAHHRRKLGLAATSIQWGALAEVGMVARHQATAAHLERIGLRGIPPRDALDALGRILDASSVSMPSIAVVDADWTALLEHMDLPPSATRSFAALATRTAGSDDRARAESGRSSQLLTRLHGLDAQAALSHMTSVVLDSVAGVMRLPAGELDPHVPLRDLGLDSILALEIVSDLEKSTGMKLPALTVTGGPPPHQIAAALLTHGR